MANISPQVDRILWDLYDMRGGSRLAVIEKASEGLAEIPNIELQPVEVQGFNAYLPEWQIDSLFADVKNEEKDGSVRKEHVRKTTFDRDFEALKAPEVLLGTISKIEAQASNRRSITIVRQHISMTALHALLGEDMRAAFEIEKVLLPAQH